jgi:hypothetical protein
MGGADFKGSAEATRGVGLLALEAFKHTVVWDCKRACMMDGAGSQVGAENFDATLLLNAAV